MSLVEDGFLDTQYYMLQAIVQANIAYNNDDVPIGAVVVYNGQIVGSGHNRRVSDNDPTGHAEIVAMRCAGKALNRYNLSGCDLFVTLEPCVMCAGAVVNARINHVYFGAYDIRFGGVCSLYKIGSDNLLNHRYSHTGGILQQECAALLTQFFKNKRDT